MKETTSSPGHNDPGFFSRKTSLIAAMSALLVSCGFAPRTIPDVTIERLPVVQDLSVPKQAFGFICDGSHHVGDIIFSPGDIRFIAMGPNETNPTLNRYAISASSNEGACAFHMLSALDRDDWMSRLFNFGMIDGRIRAVRTFEYGVGQELLAAAYESGDFGGGQAPEVYYEESLSRHAYATPIDSPYRPNSDTLLLLSTNAAFLVTPITSPN